LARDGVQGWAGQSGSGQKNEDKGGGSKDNVEIMMKPDNSGRDKIKGQECYSPLAQRSAVTPAGNLLSEKTARDP